MQWKRLLDGAGWLLNRARQLARSPAYALARALTYDGTTMRIYVNGTQVATRAQTGAMATSSNALKIGGNAIWGEWFAGQIDEVRVFNRALTAAEIGNVRDTPL